MNKAQEKQYSERVNEPTPSGGAYYVAYFFDGNGKPVEKEDAKEFIIQEFDQDGNMILETITNPVVFAYKA